MEVLWSQTPTKALVTLDVSVDPPHKQIRTKITHSSTQNSQSKTKHQSVSKIEAGLEEA